MLQQASNKIRTLENELGTQTVGAERGSHVVIPESPLGRASTNNGEAQQENGAK